MLLVSSDDTSKKESADDRIKSMPRPNTYVNMMLPRATLVSDPSRSPSDHALAVTRAEQQNLILQASWTISSRQRIIGEGRGQ